MNRMILIVLAILACVGAISLVQSKDPSDDMAKIQRYHARRSSGQALAEKWARGNITGQEKDELLRVMAFEMYGVE